jgi:hypothetical protein
MSAGAWEQGNRTWLSHKSQRKMANASAFICDGVRKTIAFEKRGVQSFSFRG